MATTKFERAMASAGSRLRTLILKNKTVALVYATVLSVDKDNNTMSVSIGSEVTLPDISLAPVDGGNANALFYPAIGSLVVLGFVEDRPEMSFPIAFTEVTQINIQFVFSGGSPSDMIEIDGNKVDVTRGGSNITISDDSISASIGNNTIEMDGTTVSINNGHLTIT